MRIVVTIAILGLCGCGATARPGVEIHGENEVYVYVPTSRMEMPEPMPKTFGMGSGVATMTRYTLTDDQLDREPASGAIDGDVRSDVTGRFDVQPSPHGVVSALARGDGTVMAQLKWHARATQWPEQRWSGAVTVAYGGRKEGFSSTRTCGFVTSCSAAAARTDVRREVHDGAIIVGYALSEAWLLFGGPFYSVAAFDVEHFSDRGSAPDVERRFRRAARIAGANLGVARRVVNWGRFLGELSVSTISRGGADETYVHAGLAQEFYFGWRADASAYSRASTSAAARSPDRTAPSM